MHLGAAAMSPQVLSAFSHACLFMEVTGDVVMAWMLLWRASIAAAKLADGPKKKDVPYYEGLIKSAEFFVETVLPVTFGRMNALFKTSRAAIEISDASFGGK